jgi:hypothetical protein
MRLEAIRQWWLSRTRLEQAAVIIWSLVLLTVGVRVAISPRAHSVFPIFTLAGRHWQHAEELYYPYFNNPDLDLFRYSPLAAAFFAPWSALSDRIGNVLWRLVSAGFYLSALGWWAKAVLPVCLTRSQTALFFLLAVPLSISCLNNGQSNVLMLALLLGSMAAVQTGRWNFAAALLALATLLKIYPGALGLLLALVFPRKFGGRFALALGLCLALPFLLQSPEYVARQYAHWWGLLLLDHRVDRPVSNMVSRDLWLIIRLAHIPIGLLGYRVVQLFLAGGAALVCLAARWAGWPQRRLLTMLFSLAGCWMVLCGPASESCTYILVAPILAWAVLEAYLDQRSWRSQLIASGSFALFVFSQTISWFPENTRMLFLGLLPLAGVVLALSVVESNMRGFFRKPRRIRQPEETPLARAA